tara:strand:+ start:1179 stop:1583 length:405 start_codon:yes stop_codon:yes gene_type:complete
MPKYTSVTRNKNGKLTYTYDKEQNHKYRRGSCISHKRSGASRHAKVKGIEFNLTLVFLKKLWETQEGKCKYTGRALGNIGDGFDSPSIDRIDSNKGYTEDNVQWLCWGANEMKKNYSEAFFLDICKTIGEHDGT